MRTAFTLGMEPSGREHVVVVVKATYAFPEQDGGHAEFASEQDDLVTADTFWGEPGFSAPRHEVDFARFKAQCDVLLNATAHAPGGRPVERVQTGIRIGSWQKRLDVVGNRVWLDGITAPNVSSIEPFVRMPITYDRAFGGTDRLGEEDGILDAYRPNPVGLGFHDPRNQDRLAGQPLPNTEAPGEPVTSPWGDHAPMSYGPVGRGWSQRLRWAGTYDERWQQEVFPFLPADFDDRYYQAAPEDQWIAYPRGGEEVVLVGLTPEGRTRFRLPPRLAMPVTFAHRTKGDIATEARPDTLLIEPDRRRLCMTWRVSQPLDDEIFEISHAIVGPRPRGFWRARRLGKRYYGGLRDLTPQRDTE
jgi:hypothetical protein